MHACQTDDELRTALAEARSFLDGLVRECNARHWGVEAVLLSSAMEDVAETGRLARVRGLQPWEFLKPDGSTGICSWCEQEHQHPPSELASHGICPRHVAALRAELSATRRVPVNFL